MSILTKNYDQFSLLLHNKILEKLMTYIVVEKMKLNVNVKAESDKYEIY